MGNATSSNENHAVSRVVGLDIASELGSGNITDVLSRAEDSTAQRLMLVGSGVKMVEDNLIYLLLYLLGFSENNVALPFDSRGFELRVLENIGEDVDTLRNVGVEGSREVDSVLTLWWG